MQVPYAKESVGSSKKTREGERGFQKGVGKHENTRDRRGKGVLLEGSGYSEEGHREARKGQGPCLC